MFAGIPLLLVAVSPVPVLLLAYTPVPLPDAFPYTPRPLGVTPYTPQPLPACEPHIPIPSPPVPLFMPRTALEKPPGVVEVIVPRTPTILAAALELVPSIAAPSPTVLAVSALLAFALLAIEKLPAIPL